MDPHWSRNHDDTYNGAHPSQNQSHEHEQYQRQHQQPFDDEEYDDQAYDAQQHEGQPYEGQRYEGPQYEAPAYEDRSLNQAALYANTSYASEDQQLVPAPGQSLNQADVYAGQNFAYEGQRLNPAQRHNYPEFDIPSAGDNNLYRGPDSNNGGRPLVGPTDEDATTPDEDLKPIRNGPSFDRTRRTQQVENQVEDEDEGWDDGEDLELTITSMAQSRQEAGRRIAEAIESRNRALAREETQIDFPESDDEQLKCVKMLVAAINNTIGIEDKPCRNGRPSQSAQRFSRRYYPAEAIELCAWGILVRISPSQR